MAKRGQSRGRGSAKQVKGYGNPRWFKYIASPCILVMIVMGGLYFYDQIGAKSNESGIEYIQSFIASSGNLVDYQNKLGMKDPATDLKWYKTDDEVRIDFGRIILKYSLEEFMSEKVQGDLASIGITSQVIKEKTGNVLHLYYLGEEIQRWVH